MQLHISVAAETIGHLLGFPITNSLLMTWIVMGFLILVAALVGGSLRRIPSSFQLIWELLIGGLYDFFATIVGKDKIDRLFPLLATIFIFVLFSNWAGLIPGLSAIGLTEEPAAAEHTLVKSVSAETELAPETLEIIENPEGTQVSEVAEIEPAEKHATFIPLFRGPTADLNTTFALALISVGAMVYFGISALGGGFFRRYFDFSNPIMTFVGLLELISDISKVLSFAFRLFGNIFAGEVLLSVIGYIVSLMITMPLFNIDFPILAPIPFLALEVFVGLIQALVFAMLTGVFISIATVGHGDAHAEAAAH